MKKELQSAFGAAALSLILFCGIAAADDSAALTYHSPEVGCDWLDAEYRRIKSHADSDRDDGERPSVTREGVMMTFGMIFSLPSILFGEAFGDKSPRYDFSLDPDDLSAAAEKKQCAALLDVIARDRRNGNYPPRLHREGENTER